MTDQHQGGSGQASADQLNDEGAGMGLGDEATTFEPEETPEAVDEPETGADAQDGPVIDDVVEPRELVPDEDRVDEVEMPHDVLPDDERDVEDDAEQESERLLPDEERPVPGGPADD